MRSSSIFLALAVLISSAAAQSPIIDYGTTDETFMDDTQDDVGYVTSTYDTEETLTVSADDQISGDDVDSISPGAEEQTPSPVADAFTPAPVPTPALSTKAPASPPQTPTPSTAVPTAGSRSSLLASSSPSGAPSEGPLSEENGVVEIDDTGSARGWFTSHYGGWRAALTFFLAGALGASLRKGWLFARVF